MIFVVHAWGMHPLWRQKIYNLVIPSSPGAETLPLMSTLSSSSVYNNAPPLRETGGYPRGKGILNMCKKTTCLELCRPRISNGLDLAGLWWRVDGAFFFTILFIKCHIDPTLVSELLSWVWTLCRRSFNTPLVIWYCSTFSSFFLAWVSGDMHCGIHADVPSIKVMC